MGNSSRKELRNARKDQKKKKKNPVKYTKDYKLKESRTNKNLECGGEERHGRLRSYKDDRFK